MTRIVGVVLTYHPDASIKVNLEALLSQVTVLVIVDNESTDSSKALLNEFIKDSDRSQKINIIFNEKNLGVAEGYNQGVRWGYVNDFDYFLLMDQDSLPLKNMVETLVAVSEEYLGKNQLTLVGPRHEDYTRKLLLHDKRKIESQPLLITSGSLIPRKLIDLVGYYDERLFIDHVDHDYSLRVARKGGLCLKVNAAQMLHKFGDAQVKSLFGKSFFIQNYSPFRRYYMMRNRIILYRRHGFFGGTWVWIDLKVAIKDVVKLLFFESRKYEKIGEVFRGIKDGILWRD